MQTMALAEALVKMLSRHFIIVMYPQRAKKRRVDSSLLLSFVRQMYRLIFSFNSLAMSLGVIEELGKMLIGYF